MAGRLFSIVILLFSTSFSYAGFKFAPQKGIVVAISKHYVWVRTLKRSGKRGKKYRIHRSKLGSERIMPREGKIISFHVN